MKSRRQVPEESKEGVFNQLFYLVNSFVEKIVSKPA